MLECDSSRAGVTQLAECLLPKSAGLSAVAPLVVTPPNPTSYALQRRRLRGRFRLVSIAMITPVASSEKTVLRGRLAWRPPQVRRKADQWSNAAISAHLVDLASRC